MVEAVLVDGRKKIDVVGYRRILIWQSIDALEDVVRVTAEEFLMHSLARIHPHMLSKYSQHPRTPSMWR